MSTPRIYLAGPDVFFPSALAIAEAHKAILARHGLEGVFPLDNQITASTLKEKAQAIFVGNCDLLDSCDAVVANMIPFRGPSADVGTAWEMGYAFAQKKPVVAYTEDLTIYRDKVREAGYFGDPLAAVDRHGHEVEDYQGVDNLMLTHCASALCASFQEAAEHLATLFKGR